MSENERENGWKMRKEEKNIRKRKKKKKEKKKVIICYEIVERET